MVQADPDKAVGYQYPDLPVAWLQRDILLYCSGIGAKRDELQFLYELHPDWAPFFSYPLVLPFKGNSQSVQDLLLGRMRVADSRDSGTLSTSRTSRCALVFFSVP